MRWRCLVVALGVFLAACQASPAPPAPTAAFLPNPASAYCEANGHRLEIRTAADGSQSGVCIFTDGSECDEWAYYRGECGPGATPTATAPVAPPTLTALAPTVTPLPTPLGGYAGWQTYTHADPAFTFLYPPDWVVEPEANPVSTLYQHALFVRPAAAAERVSLRVVFRPAGNDLLLWPTGVGEGEFVPRGAAPFGGGLLERRVLVCQARDLAVWYRPADGPAAQLGDLEFSFILAAEGACADGLSVTAATQAIGDLLVASFQP